MHIGRNLNAKTRSRGPSLARLGLQVGGIPAGSGGRQFEMSLGFSILDNSRKNDGHPFSGEMLRSSQTLKLYCLYDDVKLRAKRKPALSKNSCFMGLLANTLERWWI